MMLRMIVVVLACNYQQKYNHRTQEEGYDDNDEPVSEAVNDVNDDNENNEYVCVDDIDTESNDDEIDDDYGNHDAVDDATAL